MDRPPRSPKTPLLDGVLIGRIALVGALLLAWSFGLFELFKETGHTLAEARTVAVNVFVFGEMFYLFNCRSLTQPSWKAGLRANHFLFGGVGLMVALQLLYTYLPGMNRLFGSAPMGATGWAWVLGAAFVIHVVVEIEKWVRRLSARRHPPANVC